MSIQFYLARPNSGRPSDIWPYVRRLHQERPGETRKALCLDAIALLKKETGKDCKMPLEDMLKHFKDRVLNFKAA